MTNADKSVDIIWADFLVSTLGYEVGGLTLLSVLSYKHYLFFISEY